MENEGLKFMMINSGSDNEMICRFISKWGKVDSQVSSIEDLILRIEVLNPDAVEVDMGLYDRIGGIDTIQMIKDRLDINAWFE